MHNTLEAGLHFIWEMEDGKEDAGVSKDNCYIVSDQIFGVGNQYALRSLSFSIRGAD